MCFWWIPTIPGEMFNVAAISFVDKPCLTIDATCTSVLVGCGQAGDAPIGFDQMLQIAFKNTDQPMPTMGKVVIICSDAEGACADGCF